jgi:hypothetical protein
MSWPLACVLMTAIVCATAPYVVIFYRNKDGR